MASAVYPKFKEGILQGTWNLSSAVVRGVPGAAPVPRAGAGVGGAWWWTTARFLQSTDNATLQGDIAVLSSRIEGDVAEILVADNQAVRAGDPLLRLEDRDWRARLAQA